MRCKVWFKLFCLFDLHAANCPSITCFKRLLFLHWSAFMPLGKSVDQVCLSLFLNSLFCSANILVYLTLIPYGLDYYSFIITLQVRQCDYSNSACVFFKIVLVLWRHLHLCMKSRCMLNNIDQRVWQRASDNWELPQRAFCLAWRMSELMTCWYSSYQQFCDRFVCCFLVAFVLVLSAPIRKGREEAACCQLSPINICSVFMTDVFLFWRNLTFIKNLEFFLMWCQNIRNNSQNCWWLLYI